MENTKDNFEYLLDYRANLLALLSMVKDPILFRKQVEYLAKREPPE